MEGVSSTATWPVLHGALQSCISLESSLSPLDPTFAVSDPLILQRPPTDSAPPCDITIVFPTKHEIRQIYVRSTARMYEIYYSPDSKSTNEYLCTVRCGPVQDSTENESRFVGEMSSRSSNTSNSDDSWVDVTKSPESDASKINVSPPRTKEDLYEATAEISDAEPCISLTLRLVSIQSTGYVCVDEIYVYGDPVDDDNDDIEEQKNKVGNAAGSSLMALLAPTLLQLQLSKSGIGDTANNCNHKQANDHISHNTGSHVADSTVVAHENLPEVTPSVSSQQAASYHLGHVAANAAEPNKSHVPNSVPDEVVNHIIVTNDQQSRIEKALNELISRVIKIEDTCSRFEENMRKPICSIEERLSKVENQLAVLTMNSQNTRLASGTRFSAPDWSCIESGSHSSDVDESNPICGAANTDVNHSVSTPSQPPGDGSYINLETIEVPPSISSANLQYETHDVEGTYPSIPIHDTSLEQPKKTVSIDDALASALAAFMSSGRPETLNKGFSIRAPEYLTSEESENSNGHSVSHCSETTSSIRHEDETEDTVMKPLNKGFSARASEYFTTEDSEYSNGHSVSHCKENTSSVIKECVSSFYNTVHEVNDLPGNDPSSDQIELHNEDSLYRKSEIISQLMNCEGTRVEERNESCLFDKLEGGAQYLTDEEVYDDLVGLSCNDDSVNADYTAEEVTCSDDSMYLGTKNEVGDHQQKACNDKEATNQEALFQVTELARIPSPVNFDTSVLDVMFVSGNISSTTSSLEVLLTDTTAGYQVEAPCDAEVNGSSGDATSDHDFISLEKETSILEFTKSSLNMHHFDFETTSMGFENNSTEIETIKDSHFDLSHEVFPASLI